MPCIACAEKRVRFSPPAPIAITELNYSIDEFEVELAKWQKAKVKKIIIDSVVDVSQIGS